MIHPELRFFNGTMASMKTATLLMTNHSLRAKGLKVLLLKSAIDTRSGTDVIASRIGLCATADGIIERNTCISSILPNPKPDIILIDECQFLSETQIDEIRKIVCQGIPIYCYGLKTDASSHLFEGSKRLIELADNIIELENHCECGQKAILNARIDEHGKVIIPNNQIDIGGNEKYKPMCFNCWYKNQKNTKKLIAFVGPSGCGKTTIIDSIIDAQTKGEIFPYTFTKIKSHTSKDTRLEDYVKVSVEEFEKMIANEEFVEYTNYSGNYYGLSKKTIENLECIGIKAFDIIGAKSLKKLYGDSVVTVFIRRDTKKLIESINDRKVSAVEKQTRISQLESEQENAARDEIDYILDVIENDIPATINKLMQMIQ